MNDLFSFFRLSLTVTDFPNSQFLQINLGQNGSIKKKYRLNRNILTVLVEAFYKQHKIFKFIKDITETPKKKIYI